MYNSSSEKDVLQCPYNKYHIISSLRFSRHLVKCERVSSLDSVFLCIVVVSRNNVIECQVFLELPEQFEGDLPVRCDSPCEQKRNQTTYQALSRKSDRRRIFLSV